MFPWLGWPRAGARERERKGAAADIRAAQLLGAVRRGRRGLRIRPQVAADSAAERDWKVCLPKLFAVGRTRTGRVIHFIQHPSPLRVSYLIQSPKAIRLNVLKAIRLKSAPGDGS